MTLGHLGCQAVSVPVRWLDAEQTSYCLLSNTAGEMVAEHLFVPQANRQDTIHLFVNDESGPFHLTILTKYSKAEFSLQAFAKVMTVLNVEPGWVLESSIPAPATAALFANEVRTENRIELSFSEQEKLLYNVLLPSGVSVKRNSYFPRSDRGLLKLRDYGWRPFYLYLQHGKEADWRYLYFNGQHDYDQTWSMPEI